MSSSQFLPKLLSPTVGILSPKAQLLARAEIVASAADETEPGPVDKSPTPAMASPAAVVPELRACGQIPDP